MKISPQGTRTKTQFGEFCQWHKGNHLERVFFHWPPSVLVERGGTNVKLGKVCQGADTVNVFGVDGRPQIQYSKILKLVDAFCDGIQESWANRELQGGDSERI